MRCATQGSSPVTSRPTGIPARRSWERLPLLRLDVQPFHVIVPAVRRLGDDGIPEGAGALRLTIMSTTASRTIPTLSVLVIVTGVSSTPVSSIQCVPVMSPLPLPA